MLILMIIMIGNDQNLIASDPFDPDSHKNLRYTPQKAFLVG